MCKETQYFYKLNKSLTLIYPRRHTEDTRSSRPLKQETRDKFEFSRIQLLGNIKMASKKRNSRSSSARHCDLAQILHLSLLISNYDRVTVRDMLLFNRSNVLTFLRTIITHTGVYPIHGVSYAYKCKCNYSQSPLTNFPTNDSYLPKSCEQRESRIPLYSANS